MAPPQEATVQPPASLESVPGPHLFLVDLITDVPTDHLIPLHWGLSSSIPSLGMSSFAHS